MALVMTPIFTQTVGAAGASYVVFNNIPQHFTDLKLMFSCRSSATVFDAAMGLQFNNDLGSSNVYSIRNLVMYYVSPNLYAGSFAGTNANSIGSDGEGASNTADTFSNGEALISNYSDTTKNKSVIVDAVMENNGTQATFGVTAGLYRNNNAITSLTVTTNTGFTQYSTFTLYGIIRSGA